MKKLPEKASTTVAIYRRTTRKVSMQRTVVEVDEVDEDERATLTMRLYWTKSK
jgi:hypothetical protein